MMNMKEKQIAFNEMINALKEVESDFIKHEGQENWNELCFGMEKYLREAKEKTKVDISFEEIGLYRTEWLESQLYLTEEEKMFEITVTMIVALKLDNKYENSY